MKRTENLYKELKSKIEGLVEFMVSNDLNSADISLELNKEFTLCNVKYKGDDEIKDEFLYLFSDFEKSKIDKQIEDGSLDDISTSNEEVVSNLGSTNEEPKYMEPTKLESETAHTKPVEESSICAKPKEEINLDKSKSEDLLDEENEPSEKDTETKEKSTENLKGAINFKDELIFQKEMILSILKEYNLIS